VHLALHSGLRRGEIFGAGIDDIHYDNSYVVVKGAAKGRYAGGGARYREVPHTDDSRRAIHDWLEPRSVLLGEFGEDHDRPWLVLHPAATPNNSTRPSSPPSSRAAPMRLNAFKARKVIGAGPEIGPPATLGDPHAPQRAMATDVSAGRVRNGLMLGKRPELAIPFAADLADGPGTQDHRSRPPAHHRPELWATTACKAVGRSPRAVLTLLPGA
jgi:integrase